MILRLLLLLAASMAQQEAIVAPIYDGDYRQETVIERPPFVDRDNNAPGFDWSLPEHVVMSPNAFVRFGDDSRDVTFFGNALQTVHCPVSWPTAYKLCFMSDHTP